MQIEPIDAAKDNIRKADAKPGMHGETSILFWVHLPRDQGVNAQKWRGRRGSADLGYEVKVRKIRKMEVWMEIVGVNVKEDTG